MYELGVALDVEDGLLELGAYGVHGFERIVLEDLPGFHPRDFLSD